jgi:hypothetical protein
MKMRAPDLVIGLRLAGGSPTSYSCPLYDSPLHLQRVCSKISSSGCKAQAPPDRPLAHLLRRFHPDHITHMPLLHVGDARPAAAISLNVLY